jgi:hypothetical protein
LLSYRRFGISPKISDLAWRAQHRGRRIEVIR